MAQENEPHMQPINPAPVTNQGSMQGMPSWGSGQAPLAGGVYTQGQAQYIEGNQQPQGSSTVGGFPQALPQNRFGQAPQYGVPNYGYAQQMGWGIPSTPQFEVNNQADAYQNNPQQPTFVEQPNYSANYAHTVNGGMAPNTAPVSNGFDYSYINTPARIAVYDSLKTAPRVIQIDAGPTHEYIEHIASETYKNAKDQGGMIPYTVIREVSENFIHANFEEVVVSIFDQGNTIRFADQGPGIKQKELAQEPGFSSAVEPMKRYIRGVGSGLPIVKDYLSTAHGRIEIEDNVDKGSVVTISLVAAKEKPESDALVAPDFTENEEKILKALLPNKTLGVTETSNETGIAVASVHTAFSKMEEAGIIEKVNKKRRLTPQGTQIALSL